MQWVDLVFLVCVPSGGLTAVIYTDTLSAFVMVLGAMVVSIKGILLPPVLREQRTF